MSAVAVDFAVFAAAPPTMSPTASAATKTAMVSFFTPCPPSSSEPPARHGSRYGPRVQTRRADFLATPDRHLLPSPDARGRGRKTLPVDISGGRDRPHRRPHRPRRVEDAPERERRGAPDGRAVAEGRRKHLERARPCGERP